MLQTSPDRWRGVEAFVGQTLNHYEWVHSSSAPGQRPASVVPRLGQRGSSICVSVAYRVPRPWWRRVATTVDRQVQDAGQLEDELALFATVAVVGATAANLLAANAGPAIVPVARIAVVAVRSARRRRLLKRPVMFVVTFLVVELAAELSRGV